LVLCLYTAYRRPLFWNVCWEQFSSMRANERAVS
jgi:hypothetical protein